MRLRSPRLYHQSAHHKRMLVRQAKSKPCVDCLAEGRRADWPVAAMTLDHTGKKTMDFAIGGYRYTYRVSTGNPIGCPSYPQFSTAEIIKELSTCDPVCAGHHNMRTRARLLARDSEDDEGDEDESDDEIALF